MSSNDHVLDLLPGFVLDSLDEDELIQVSEHLAGCPGCRAELRAYQQVVDQLALAVPSAMPAPSLRRRLMDAIEPPQLTGPLYWQQLRSFMQQASPIWGLASLLLILALAVSTFLLWQRVNQLEAPGQLEQMQTIRLTATEIAPGATGLIVLSLDGHYGTLVVDQLPVLDPDRQYQLWLIQDGQRDSGAVFSVDEDGYGSVVISASEPLATYSAFGISVEPAGGSSGPTGDKVLGGSSY